MYLTSRAEEVEHVPLKAFGPMTSEQKQQFNVQRIETWKKFNLWAPNETFTETVPTVPVFYLKPISVFKNAFKCVCIQCFCCSLLNHRSSEHHD